MTWFIVATIFLGPTALVQHFIIKGKIQKIVNLESSMRVLRTEVQESRTLQKELLDANAYLKEQYDEAEDTLKAVHEKVKWYV